MSQTPAQGADGFLPSPRTVSKTGGDTNAEDLIEENLATLDRLPENKPRQINVGYLGSHVQRGEIFLNQFLRIRIAAGLRDGAETEKETVESLRRRLAQGEILEIAGYGLTPELAAAIDAISIVDLALKWARPIAWIELVPQAEAGLAPASRAAIERLSGAGLDVRAEAIVGPPFWAIEETTLVPGLCERTAELWNDPVR